MVSVLPEINKMNQLFLELQSIRFVKRYLDAVIIGRRSFTRNVQTAKKSISMIQLANVAFVVMKNLKVQMPTKFYIRVGS